MKVSVIAVHRDDEVLGCGATIARHARLGDDVQTIYVTTGCANIFGADKIHKIQAECIRAGQVLGLSRQDFLDFPAPKLDTIPQHILAESFCRLLKDWQPEILYIPHQGDLHFEHVITYRAALVAARPIPPYSIRKILAYETLSETDWAPPNAVEGFTPTVFTDVSNDINTKLNAMRCFKSQLKPFPNSRSIEALKALAKVRGATVGVKAAEAFQLVREVG